VSILERARAALTPAGSILILDTFLDRQRHEAAVWSLAATSLYFACLANGQSRMYSSRDLLDLVQQAGLEVVREFDGLGLGHTLWHCRPRA
jgi:hypothetical protein